MKLWLIGIYLMITYVAAAVPAYDDDMDDFDETEKTVWVGQTITLPCGRQNVLGKNRRLWRKGSDLLTAAHVVISLDERVHVSENRTLEISGATLQDAGQYTCVIIHRPKPIIYKINVTVQEITCLSPVAIANGEVRFPIGRQDGVFLFGDQIRYSCQVGFVLIGPSLINCTLPDNGWDGEPPNCTLEDVATVSDRLKSLEDKLQPLLEVGVESILDVGETVSSLETRVKQLETDSDIRIQTKSRAEGMDRDVNHVKRVLNLNAARKSWGNFLGADVATLGVQDGHVVSEYTWIIENIEKKMAAYADMDRFDYIQSEPFYTHTPGYKMVLHLYPDYDHSQHVGLFAILIRGKFDETVDWPFSNKYVLSIGSFDEEYSAISDTLDPRRTPSCDFDRPEEDNTVGCGFSKLVEHETLITRKHIHQMNGNLRVKITIFLND